MELTGKCKIEFDKWFIDSNLRELFSGSANLRVGESITGVFYKFPFSMIYGVYVDFFDSVNIWISDLAWVDINGYGEKSIETFDYEVSWIDGVNEGEFKTRNESRLDAIKQANEIYNAKY